jgi:hypothetical protein
VYGALGLAFALSWSLLACPSPDQCAYISAGEKAYLQKATKQQASGKDKKKDDDEEGGGKAAVSASSSAKSPTTTVAVLLTHASVSCYLESLVDGSSAQQFHLFLMFCV